MLSDFYPPIIGGLERYVKTLSEGLSKRGHLVTVCTIKSKHLPSFEEQKGVRIIRVDGFFQSIPFLFADRTKRYHPPIQDWLITRKLKELIEETKPDIIHVHGWILHSVLPLKKKYNIPLIVTLHDYGLFCPKKSMMKSDNQICNKPFSTDCIKCGLKPYGSVKSFLGYLGVKSNKHMLKRVDKFIAVSQYVKEVHSMHLELNEEKIVVIPNFYKEENVNSNKEEMLPEKFILFAGSLMHDRGTDVLIKAYNTIKTKTKLVIIGAEHPQYSYKSAGNVIVIKNAPHEIVMKACDRCSFLVIPSITPAACPTIALEAMSRKKAIIASDVGGLKDIVINATTGFLIPPGNSKALANAMRFLLRNPQKSKEMGKKGWDLFIKRFSLSSVLPKIEKLYEELCVSREATNRN